MTSLRAMTGAEYSYWRQQTIPDYAADKVKTGYWSEHEAVAKAEIELASAISQGLDTPGHLFLTIQDASGQSVGAVWVGVDERADGPIGFIYDLVVWSECRRKGHGAQAMYAIELEAQKRGFKGLALHVFAHNKTAQALYEQLGYAATDIDLFKPLGGASKVGAALQ